MAHWSGSCPVFVETDGQTALHQARLGDFAPPLRAYKRCIACLLSSVKGFHVGQGFASLRRLSRTMPNAAGIELVQAQQEDAPFTHLDVVGGFLCQSTVIVLHQQAHPIAGGSGEVLQPGLTVTGG